MAFRLYIVPKVQSSDPHEGLVPKYFDTVTSDVTSVDYGIEDWMLVGADLTTSEDNAIVAQPDVFGIPFDLAGFLSSAQVTAVQNKLEAINIPAGWVTTSMQWIDVVRIVFGMFQFMQRFVAVNGASLFGGGVTLGTRINQLTQTVRDNLNTAATNDGLSTAGIGGATTIRQALKILADRMVTRPIHIGAVTL